jgi:outer membrane protein OmpA-like peptidoglycan-associated protein
MWYHAPHSGAGLKIERAAHFETVTHHLPETAMTMSRPRIIFVRNLSLCALAGALAGGRASSGSTGSGSSGIGGFMQTDTGKGVAVGGVSGAAIGARIDHTDPWMGALMGAAGGALVGGVVGHRLDQQKQNLTKQLQPEINAGEAIVQLMSGNAIEIDIDMTAKTKFNADSTNISPQFYSTLQKVANGVRTYGKMSIAVIGHSDAGGTTAERAALANQRA